MIPRALIYLAAVSLAIAADDRKALETRAAKGEAEAQYLLAEKLYWAEGGPRDLEQAVDFARASAKQGNAKGQYRLAVQLLLSQGVDLSEDALKEGQQMLDAAAKGLPALAKAGDADAAFKLALLYRIGLDRFGEGLIYERRDDKAVYDLVEQAAKGGHISAQLLLSAMLQNPKHPKYNLVNSVDWLRKAADQGSAHAAHKLWSIARHTNGSVVKTAEGQDRLAAAAKAGLAMAQLEYGTALNNGQIGVPDPKAGLEWVRKAADQGFATAQFVVGLEFGLGKSVERDVNQSFIWLVRARAGDLPPAIGRRLQFELDRVRKEVAPDALLGLLDKAKQFKPQPTAVTEWTEYGINSAKPDYIRQLRRELLKGPAEGGDVEAMFVMATCFGDQMIYHLDRLVFFEKAKAPERARNEDQLARDNLAAMQEWLVKAADHKYLEACVVLAEMHDNGVERLTKPAPVQAANWYLKGAELGDARCMYRYASYINEEQVKGKERKDMIPWLQKAADKKHAPSLSMLGIQLVRGDLIKQDKEAAFKCFEQAAGQNYALGQRNLGQYYAEDRNYEEAIKWFQLAARQGDSLSFFALGDFFLNGLGTKKNLSKSYYWFLLAKKYGYPRIDPHLANLAKKLSAADIRQADAEAARFVAQQFYNPNGAVPESNLAKVGLKELEGKANGGNRDAQFQLGLRYAKGEGVPTDGVKAYQWLYTAEKRGHPAAQAERKQMMKVLDMTSSQIRAGRDLARAFLAKNP